jgi:hypothetical protein
VKSQRQWLKLNPRKSQAPRQRAMTDGMAQCLASWALGLGRLNYVFANPVTLKQVQGDDTATNRADA